MNLSHSISYPHSPTDDDNSNFWLARKKKKIKTQAQKPPWKNHFSATVRGGGGGLGVDKIWNNPHSMQKDA